MEDEGPELDRRRDNAGGSWTNTRPWDRTTGYWIK